MKMTLCICSMMVLLAACSGEPAGNNSQPDALVPALSTSSEVASTPSATAADTTAPTTSDAPLLPRAGDTVAPRSETTASASSQSAPEDPARRLKLAATILNPEGMPPMAAMSYNLARDVPDRLEKLYCYCHCHEDPLLKHKSLLSCYQDHHAVDCAVCQNEAKQAWLDWKDGVPVEVSVKEINLMYNGGNPAPSTPIPEAN